MTILRLRATAVGLALAAVSFTPFVASSAQSTDPVRAAVSLDAFAFMAGRWQAAAFGGTLEEAWDRPWDGSMIGTCKVSVDGNPSFYEFMSITIDSAGPVMKIKHFNPDFTGWEEKGESTVFPFIGVSDNEARFEGVTYTLLSDDSLRIIINLGHSEGESREMSIDCHRIRD